MQIFEAGAIVRHTKKPMWGLRKVVRVSGPEAFVYFKSKSNGVPEDNVVRLAQPGPFLARRGDRAAEVIRR